MGSLDEHELNVAATIGVPESYIAKKASGQYTRKVRKKDRLDLCYSFVNTCHPEFIFGNMKIYLHFLSFLSIEVA